MRNPSFLVFFFGLLAVAEWYGYQAFRTVFQSTDSGSRRLTAGLYWGVSVLIWVLGFWAMRNRQEHASFKSYLGGLLLAMIAAKIVILIPLLLEDLTRLGRWALQLGNRPAGSAGTAISRSEFLSKAALVLGAIPFVSLLWGMAKGGTDYTVRRVVLRFPNLPASFDGFKLLQISDLHTGSFHSKEPLQRAVQLINEQQADQIFMTGDLVNNYATEVEEHIDTLAGIQSKLPIYSILGNHDYGDYVPEFKEDRSLWNANLARLKQNHAKIGWELLLDEARTVERNGEKIAILGVQNWGARMGFPKYGQLAKAHSAADANAPFKILLSHDPSHWEGEVQQYEDIDLMLAGHTHGMQFGVNLSFLKWSPVQYAYKQWAGLYQRGKQYLYVNAGLGFIGYHGRVGFLPEITVFELRRG